jgi:hypothetical protein
MANGRNILIIGIDPDAIDYTQPGLPPGVSAEYLKAGLRAAKEGFQRQGDTFDMCNILLDGTAEASITKMLKNRSYDCIVIGGGIRQSNLILLESVVNLVHRIAPQSAIAFNNQPQDTVEAVARVLPRSQSPSPA